MAAVQDARQAPSHQVSLAPRKRRSRHRGVQATRDREVGAPTNLFGKVCKGSFPVLGPVLQPGAELDGKLQRVTSPQSAHAARARTCTTETGARAKMLWGVKGGAIRGGTCLQRISSSRWSCSCPSRVWSRCCCSIAAMSPRICPSICPTCTRRDTAKHKAQGRLDALCYGPRVVFSL